jgi:hypothetical protein
METRVKGKKELSLNDRKAIFALLWVACKHGKIEHGKKMSVAKQFQVAPKTVTRVWEQILSVMQAHLIKELMFEELQQFDNCMLPLVGMFPDHVFEAGKKGKVGRKKADRRVLAEKTLNVPIQEKGTIRNLASQLDVSKDTVHRMIGEGVFRVHSNSIKPLLTEKAKEKGYTHCVDKIDPSSINKEEWQYVGMFDEVHVDEKWFDKTFETRKYLLLTD